MGLDYTLYGTETVRKMRLDNAQRRLIADSLAKFAIALATAIAAKLFFSDEELEFSVAIAALIMFAIFAIATLLAKGTDEKDNKITAARQDTNIAHSPRKKRRRPQGQQKANDTNKQK